MFSDGFMEFSINVSATDERLISAVLDRTFPEPAHPRAFGAEEMAEYGRKNALLRRLFMWAKSDKPQSAPRNALLAEATVLERELERSSTKYARVYSSRISFSIVNDGKEIAVTSSGTGIFAGIRLNGDIEHSFTLRCDLGVCDLTMMGLDEQGRGVAKGVTDLRGQKSLLSDNVGEITIKSRPIKSGVHENIRGLIAFLSDAKSDEIAINVKSK